MSEEEVRRSGLMSRVERGELKQTEAADVLGMNYRQCKRLYARYRKQGPLGLVHRNAGRRSNRAKPEKLRCRVLRLIRAHFSATPGKRLGPTLAAEHLRDEHNLQLNSETWKSSGARSDQTLDSVFTQLR
jgi:hypothetical protein